MISRAKFDARATSSFGGAKIHTQTELRGRMWLFCPSTAALLPIFEAGKYVLILGSLPPIIGEDLFFKKHLC